MDDAQSKVCTKCGELKTFHNFNNQERGKYGKRAECKDCERKRLKANYDKAKQSDGLDYPAETAKVCSRCKTEKALTEFTPNKQKKYGRNSACKECMATHRRKRRSENKDASLVKERAYRESHRDELRANDASWRGKNPEKIKEDRRKRYKSNHAFRLRRNFLRYVRAKARIGKDRIAWAELFDFTLEQLMERLEPLFKDGMSWGNYGQWQVDHIRPVSSFDIKAVSDSAFKECWGLANLQPLWDSENKKKSSKIMVEI